MKTIWHWLKRLFGINSCCICRKPLAPGQVSHCSDECAAWEAFRF